MQGQKAESDAKPDATLNNHPVELLVAITVRDLQLEQCGANHVTDLGEDRDAKDCDAEAEREADDKLALHLVDLIPICVF